MAEETNTLNVVEDNDLAAEFGDFEAEMQKQTDAIAGERRAQVGTGDRSERIRTYNYPQGRVTDHRIGLTLYKIDQILNGDLDEVVDSLITHYRAEMLKASE